jgi:integrase
MSTNFNLLFYPKRSKRYLSGSLPVYLRITVNGKHCETSIGREIEPELWDVQRRKAKGTREEIRQFNSHLETITSKIKQIHTRMIDAEEEITSEGLRDVFLGKSAKNKMLIEVFQDHNKDMESLIGNGFSGNTFRTFKSSIKHVKGFLKTKYNLQDISLRIIDRQFIKDYDIYLRTKHGKCSPISADKYVKHLKKIILLCLNNGWITVNPFQHYKSTAKPTPRTFLTNDELSRIINKELFVERLKQVRDIFIFCCYTGLSYIDVQKLKRSEIAIGDDGKKWIFTKRHKTLTPVHLPLLSVSLQIIEQYKDHPVCEDRDTLLPVFTNQRMNSYLKEIATLCGIEKWLTFHLARHTFATTITLSNGVPIETVSKMLGHSNIKTTQHYAKVLDSKTSSDMASLEERLSNKGKQLSAKVHRAPTKQVAKIISLYSKGEIKRC